MASARRAAASSPPSTIAAIDGDGGTRSTASASPSRSSSSGQAIYAGIPNHPEDPANLFRIAIAFEQRAVNFFTERGAQCAEGSPERQLYRGAAEAARP